MKRVVFLLLAMTACSKPSESTATADAAPATSTSTSSAASAAPSASAAPAKAAPTTWTVKYTSAAATMYIPDSKDWSNTKFKNDPEKYLGDGTLTLTVDPSGAVTGKSEGPPLGDAVLAGRLEGDTLTATVRRKDPTDNGLTGTLDAKVKGDALDGAMKLADTNAAAVREAKLTGTKAK